MVNKGLQVHEFEGELGKLRLPCASVHLIFEVVHVYFRIHLFPYFLGAFDKHVFDPLLLAIFEVIQLICNVSLVRSVPQLTLMCLQLSPLMIYPPQNVIQLNTIKQTLVDDTYQWHCLLDLGNLLNGNVERDLSEQEILPRFGYPPL